MMLILCCVNATKKGEFILDRYLLEYEMKTKGVTQKQLADFLGINKSTLIRKLSGESDFTRSEIQKSKHFLSLTPEEVDRIFFTN